MQSLFRHGKVTAEYLNFAFQKLPFAAKLGSRESIQFNLDIDTMLKTSAALLATVFSISAVAQEIPDITVVDPEVLRVHKTLFANSANLPLFYLGRPGGEKKFQPAEYFKRGAPDYMPTPLAKIAARATSDHNEFDQRDGARAIKPWLDEMIAAAPEYEYVLLRAEGQVGTYNFDTQSFPTRVKLGSKFDIKKNTYAGYCAGATARSANGYHVPCIAIAGFNKSSGAYIRLPVEDEQTARHLSKLHSVDRFAYMMLVRMLNKPEIIATSDWGRNVNHVMSATPVALYVFDTKDDRLLTRVAITTKTSKKTTGPTVDDSGEKISSKPMLAPVSHTTTTRSKQDKSAPPTISLD